VLGVAAAQDFAPQLLDKEFFTLVAAAVVLVQIHLR
jgi:hypothetical protein